MLRLIFIGKLCNICQMQEELPIYLDLLHTAHTLKGKASKFTKYRST